MVMQFAYGIIPVDQARKRCLHLCELVDDSWTGIMRYVFASGISDLAALEFVGSSLDTTPPTVARTFPAAIHNQDWITSVVDPTAFDLRNAGANGVFDDGDDVVQSQLPLYNEVPRQLNLRIEDGALSAGTYRSTVRQIHDLSGLVLDGDADGQAGGDYVRIFNVAAAPMSSSRPRYLYLCCTMHNCR